MGMFDKVWIKCPTCKEEVEFQSKGGECLLIDYTFENAPNSVLEYIVGETQMCSQGHRITVKLPPENRLPFYIEN